MSTDNMVKMGIITGFFAGLSVGVIITGVVLLN